MLDSSALFAALDESEQAYVQTRRSLEREPGPLLLSPFVLAEVDYFLLRELDVQHELSFLREVSTGAYELVPFEASDLEAASTVIARYADLAIGLTDASIVVLAERYGTDRVLTLDERHFRALRTSDGRPFTLLPADA